MTKSWQRWIAVVALVSYAGCSKAPSEPKPATPPANQTGAETSAPLITGQTVQAQTPASQTVALFLESLKKADAVQTRNLLTEAAQAEIDRKGITIDPLGATDSQFTIGRTQFSDKDADAAFVEAEWSEPMEDGTSHKSEVVFTVHKENEAWKISGLLLETGAPGNTVIVDFENMPDMTQAAQAQAAQPAVSKVTSPAPQQAQAQQPATAVQPAATQQPASNYSVPAQATRPLGTSNSLR